MTTKLDLDALPLFVSQPHECSYYAQRLAQTLFTNEVSHVTQKQYSKLNRLGFRRSGDYIYRPHCTGCNACVPARVAVHKFKPSQSQKRTLKHNADLTATLLKPEFHPEHYQLYANYINQRHADGSMYPPSPEQYKEFILFNYEFACLVEFRLQQQLVAVALVDILDDGLSAVYSFFDPVLDKRSLGSYMILWQINEAQQRNLPYVYLGYWLQEHPKMHYKASYRPLELRYFDQWRQVRLTN